MDDTPSMRRVEAIGNLNRPTQQRIECNRLVIDVVLQSLPFKQLDRKEGPALMLANFINSADIRVIDGCRGARFPLETF